MIFHSGGVCYTVFFPSQNEYFHFDSYYRGTERFHIPVIWSQACRQKVYVERETHTFKGNTVSLSLPLG